MPAKSPHAPHPLPHPRLGDQLTPTLTSLAAGDPARDLVLMAELHDEATYVPHHKKKIAFLFAAMRHFAGELRAAGWRVEYVRLDAAGSRGSFTEEVARAVAVHRPERVVETEAGERRVARMMGAWGGRFGVPVDVFRTAPAGSRWNFDAEDRKESVAMSSTAA